MWECVAEHMGVCCRACGCRARGNVLQSARECVAEHVECVAEHVGMGRRACGNVL